MLVIGLGNTILGDDGAGIYTVRRLRALLAADGPLAPACTDPSPSATGRELPPSGRHQVAFAECSAGGLDLLELMLGYERVIIVDAWPCTAPWPATAVPPAHAAAGPTDSGTAPPGPPGSGTGAAHDHPPRPGEVRVFDLQAISGTPAPASLHQVGLPSAIRLARRLGLPLPAQVEIWAIASEDLRFREGCTPAVAQAVEDTALRLSQILERPSECRGEARR